MTREKVVKEFEYPPPFKQGSLFKGGPGASRFEGKFYTLKKSDVGRASIRAFGKVWLTSSFIGRVLPRDIGKHVFLRCGILLVESDQQLYRRLVRPFRPKAKR